MARSRVAVLYSRPETVLEDFRTLMHQAGYREALPHGHTTLLKPDLAWSRYVPGASTTPWQLEGVTRTLLEDGYRDLAVLESQSPVVDAYKGEQCNHFVPIFNKYHLEVRYNFEPADMAWVPYQPRTPMRVLDRLQPEGIRIPDYLIGKNVVHLPPLKTNLYTTLNGAMSNAFTGLLDTRRGWPPADLHELLVDLLALQKEIHPGMFHVMDGTTCGNGPGPRTVVPVVKDLLLASADAVALDAVAARIMGFDPMDIDFLRLAHETGLGTASLDEIDVTGTDIRELNFHFSLDGVPGRGPRSHRLPPGIRWLEDLVVKTPLSRAVTAGSSLYHDRVWYPVRGKPLAKGWLETGWGQLFARYGGDLPPLR